MVELFVDTAGWAELIDRSAPWHERAVDLFHGAADAAGVVTTSYVLSELVMLLTTRHKVGRPVVVATINALLSSPSVQVVYVDAELHAAAWALLSARLDKAWSLVDCVSFVVMQRRGLTAALTTDHHFAQAGLVRLLAPTAI